MEPSNEKKPSRLPKSSPILYCIMALLAGFFLACISAVIVFALPFLTLILIVYMLKNHGKLPWTKTLETAKKTNTFKKLDLSKFGL